MLKSNTSRSKLASQAPNSSPFRVALECALDHYFDAAWLGSNSPLAAPFMLQRELLKEKTAHHGETRGKVLQRVLAACARELSPSLDGRFDPARLLSLTFFQSHQNLNQAGIAMQLGLSPATYYRHRLEALALLEDALARTLQPTTRTELVPPPRPLVGRDQLLDSCVTALSRGQCVAISGGSGLGKTSLGAAVARRLTSQSATGSAPTFWYTFRRGLNDHTEAFLYALANFLLDNGQNGLWLQLTAGQTKINEQVALDLAQSGLAQINPKPLMVLDEIDILLPADSDTIETVRLRSLIEAIVQTPHNPLTAVFPVLLIGQQLLLEPNVHHVLHGLSTDQARIVTSQSNIQLNHDEARALQVATRGNPLLLKLFCSLIDGSSTVKEALSLVQATPTVGLLLQRIRRKFTLQERMTMDFVSVFRGYLPADLVTNDAVVDRLAQLELMTRDGSGGIALLPTLREAWLQQTSAEARQHAHKRAAAALAIRSHFTESAWHLVNARESAQAISLWFPARSLEIGRGNAGTALEIFNSISREELSPEPRRMLILIRAELRRLIGESDAILDDMDAVSWPGTDPLAGAAFEIKGDVLRDSDQPERAAAQYLAGLAALETASQRIESQRARLHIRLGDAYWLAGDMPGGFRQALRGRYAAEQFQGIMFRRRGDLEAALRHYTAALELAQQAEDPAACAMVHSQLAWLNSQRGAPTEAEDHFERALAGFEQVGDVVGIMRCKTNLGAHLIQNRQFEASLTPATEAVAFFKRLKQPAWMCTNLGNAAEANLELGNLDEAEQLSTQVLAAEEQSSRPYALTVLGRVHLARAQLSLSERYLREAVQMAAGLEDRWAEAPARRTLAACLRAQNLSQDAQAECEAAIALYVALGLPWEVDQTRLICG